MRVIIYRYALTHILTPTSTNAALSAQPHEEQAFQSALHSQNASAQLDLVPTRAPLDQRTASLATSASAIVFTASDATHNGAVLTELQKCGVGLLLARHHGSLSIDTPTASRLRLRVAQPPPGKRALAARAEYAIALVLALQRRALPAHARARAGCLARLPPPRVDLRGSVAGIVGTSGMASRVALMMRALGAKVLATDPLEDTAVKEAGAQYVLLPKLLAMADVLILDAPRTRATRGVLGEHALSLCKRGVHIVSTVGGGLVDVEALIEALREGRVGAAGLDVENVESVGILKMLPNVICTERMGANTVGCAKEGAEAAVKALLDYKNGEPIFCELNPGAVF